MAKKSKNCGENIRHDNLEAVVVDVARDGDHEDERCVWSTCRSSVWF
eukprot:CAMPEP_0171747998 /NCGR_PEP_ID=MMETSP0991-20121206/39827_1 /TAXON_ID=483369 /ORGANISM="non described non described, Strain CCMP2098" /LENGTH=46 /DNA_ID= /DNA_START= /DNA_END= /DNA_ORIENTATION=